MYSWENNSSEYKYESIQHGYEVEHYEEDEDNKELSLDELLENEEEELALEEVF